MLVADMHMHTQAVGPVAVTSLLLGSGLKDLISSEVQSEAQMEYNMAAIQVCPHPPSPPRSHTTSPLGDLYLRVFASLPTICAISSGHSPKSARCTAVLLVDVHCSLSWQQQHFAKSIVAGAVQSCPCSCFSASPICVALPSRVPGWVLDCC